jgi:hypothetical protein
MQAMLQAEHRVNHATQGEGESGECRGAAPCIQSNMSVRPSIDTQAGSRRAPSRSKVTLTSSDMACWPLWQDLFRRQIMPLALSRIRSELAATCRHARMLRDAATQGSIRRSSRQPRCTESRQPAAAHLKRSEGGHARPTRALRVVVCDSLTRSDSGCGASAHVCRGQTDAPRGYHPQDINLLHAAGASCVTSSIQPAGYCSRVHPAAQDRAFHTDCGLTAR